ncbi:MAG: amidase family protein [Pseudomonadota bacterium]
MTDTDSVSRRQLLQAVAGVALLGGTRGLQATPAGVNPLLELTAVEAVRRMTAGEMSAERYATALLARAVATQHLNAFISLDHAQVLAAARAADLARAAGKRLGALHGLPIPVKDSLNTADYPTSAGTPALRNFRPAEDAPLVATLRAAGAVVFGKTNLHELSYGWTSNNLAFGAVRNPYDPSRIPGGSSGGTAAAIAAHVAPLGVAEDTEGSIRVPAALCGIAGFRPSTGRYSTAAAVPISHLFDQAGPHARSVGDLALFDAVAANDTRALVARPLKGVRLAIGRRYWFEGLDPEVERISHEALQRLQAAGVELIEADVPELAELIHLTTDQVQNHDASVELAEFLRRYHAGIDLDELIARASPDIQSTFRRYVLAGAPDAVSEPAYRAAVDVHLPRLRQVFVDYFKGTGAHAVVFPATMVTAPKIGDEGLLDVGGGKLAFEVAIARNIAPGSTAALPGLVLPAGIAKDGLPVSLEFDGPAGSDRALLALGLSLERALGGIAPPPG